ncbi:MAG TPA: NAD(P)/FAD-dependent oxidoreductase [Bacteroidia bacterium]|jgi:thioredoxin reductase
MGKGNRFDVIIIGGSYAGLSAGIALGRAGREILIIDNDNPCNKCAPRAHNFITWDGAKPGNILSAAKKDLMNYPTIKFKEGKASAAKQTEKGFELILDNGERIDTKKLLFTTGITDIMPDIKGFNECWGTSVLHCPYCHGYEMKDKQTAVLGSNIKAFDLCMVLTQWTKSTLLLTDGKAKLTDEQQLKLKKHHINIIEKEVDHFEHTKGELQTIHFKDKTRLTIPVMYAKLDFKQHCDIPEKMGCRMKDGYIDVDQCQKTSLYGVYAAGDNASQGRTISLAVAAGTVAGMMLNGELSSESF